MYWYDVVLYSLLSFSADHTNCHHYGTILCLSVRRLSASHVCIVAKRYVLLQNCLKKLIGLPDCYLVVKIWTPVTPIIPQMVAVTAPPNFFALRIATKPLQLAAWLLLTAYRNLPTPYPTVSLLTPAYGTSQNRDPDPQNLA